MPVPTSVQSLLSKQNAQYEVSTIPVDENERAQWHDQHLRNMSAAKSVILQDANGRVQVIHAADTLLDLKAVNRHLGRELHAASPEEVHKFCLSHNVHSVPALPKVAGLLTLVDKSLTERKELWVDSGDEAQLLRFSGDDFKQILEDAQVADIAIPLAPLEQDDNSASDSEQILGAVRSFTQLRIKQRLEETLELPPSFGYGAAHHQATGEPQCGYQRPGSNC